MAGPVLRDADLGQRARAARGLIHRGEDPWVMLSAALWPDDESLDAATVAAAGSEEEIAARLARVALGARVAGRCGAPTLAGSSCTRRTRGPRCWQHEEGP